MPPVTRTDVRDEIEDALREFEARAFVDGAEAHRLAHKAMVAAAEEEREFWRAMKVAIAQKSIWGILQILLFLAAVGAAAKFGLGWLPWSR